VRAGGGEVASEDGAEAARGAGDEVSGHGGKPRRRVSAAAERVDRGTGDPWLTRRERR
jgi:hypothetical protein